MSKTSFIVVGGGSAGCVLANRLSEEDRHSVLLLEAGGSDLNFWVWMPIGYGKAFFNSKLNWKYQTEPDPGTDDRTSYWPRGKVLGGSSSINAMVYVRGQPQDFDDWKARGNDGWGWKEVLPYFIKAECNDQGGSEFRGDKGPLSVSTMDKDLHPLCSKFIDSGVECGYSHNRDFNGVSQEGFGLYQNTVKNGLRMSAARAYLRPVRSRQNLRIEKNAHVTRVLFEGKRAYGVEYLKNGKLHKATADREVILSAGAINSPQILQLSGVGPTQLLNEHGIEIVHPLNSVGENLQDHLCIDHLYRSRVPTLNNQLHPIWGKLWHGIRYVATRRGPLSLGVNQGGAFVKTQPDAQVPDMQLYFSPVSYTKAPTDKRPLMNPDSFPGFLLSAQPTRPTSRGTVQIRSSNPLHYPSIRPNYLSTSHDVELMLAGARLLRRLAATDAFSAVIDSELLPGEDVQSDDEMIADIRERATTVFHPVGTCRMGTDPNNDVVDSKLRVYGVDRLRVVDASIFPTITSGNTNAPVIMVAEKAADMILSDQQSFE